MSQTRVTRTINAPPEMVFKTVSDITQFSKALPHIVNVEFLSEKKSGVGTRFRETRLMNGRETQTELEVTEFVENDHIRLVAVDTMGTTWDTLFSVKAEHGGTLLSMAMHARPQKWYAKILLFFIGGMVQKAVEKDMDMVKAYCEK